MPSPNSSDRSKGRKGSSPRSNAAGKRSGPKKSDRSSGKEGSRPGGGFFSKDRRDAGPSSRDKKGDGDRGFSKSPGRSRSFSSYPKDGEGRGSSFKKPFSGGPGARSSSGSRDEKDGPKRDQRSSGPRDGKFSRPGFRDDKGRGYSKSPDRNRSYSKPPEDGDAPKRPYRAGARGSSDSKPFGDREKKPGGFKDRRDDSAGKGYSRSSDRPRPSREDGDAPKRPYSAGARGSSEPRAFGDRDKKPGGFRERRDDRGERSSSKSSDRPSPRREDGDAPKRPYGAGARGSSESRAFGDRDKRSGGFKDSRNSAKDSSKSSDRSSSDRPAPRPRSGDSDKRGFKDDRGDKPVGKFERQGLKRGGKSLHPDKESDNHETQERMPAVLAAPIRLNRYIANSGVCSRREADELITMGLITVNGKVVTTLGSKVNPGDEVRHDSKILRAEKPVYILLNKPKGFLTTTTDPQERSTVMHIVGNVVKERIYPVGRLDRNTTGLLLLTNDGELADKLMHPSYNIKKIYKVELDRPLTKADAVRIQEGIQMEEGKAMVDDLAIISEDNKTVGLEIHIGWNRVVRRIFESLEYQVVKLDRSVYAGLTKKDLGRGEWRFLTKEELVLLKHYK